MKIKRAGKISSIALFVGVLLFGYTNCKSLEPGGGYLQVTVVGNPKQNSKISDVISGFCRKAISCNPNLLYEICVNDTLGDSSAAESFGSKNLGVNTGIQVGLLESQGFLKPNFANASSCSESIERGSCESFNRPSVREAILSLASSKTDCRNIYRNSDRVVSLGGENGPPINSIFEFVSSKLNWYLRGQLPKPMSRFSFAEGFGRNYILGGWDGTTVTSAIFESSDNLIWKNIGKLPAETIQFSTSRFKNRIWIVGGTNSLSMPVGSTAVYSTENFVQFQVEPSLPIPLFNHNAIVFDGRLLVIGGESNINAVSDLVYEFDFEKRLWMQIGRMPAPRSGGIIHAFDNKIYLVGGWDQDHRAQNTVFSSADGASWTTADPFPKDLGGGSSWVIEGQSYIFADASIYRTRDFKKWEGVSDSPTHFSLGWGYAGPVTDWSGEKP